ncbi:MAG TPA: hypothetical protein VEC37_00835 [Bacillota bacterium]|nr:hypothetical protein [Bacillota bacterium]
MIKQNNSDIIKLSDVLQAKMEIKNDFIEEFKRQTAGISEMPRTLESEQAALKSQLLQKHELDARFAEIIEMIRETRRSIEQTIAEEFEKNSDPLRSTRRKPEDL